MKISSEPFSSKATSNDHNTYSLSGCQSDQAFPAELSSILYHVRPTTPISSGPTPPTNLPSLCQDANSSHICHVTASKYGLT